MEKKFRSIPCEICFTELNCYDHRPLVLPCGHTICSVSVEKIFKNGELQCPKDKKVFAFQSPDDVTPNFFLLSLLESSKEVRFNVAVQDELVSQFQVMVSEVRPKYDEWNKIYRKLKERVTSANQELGSFKEQINKLID